MTTLSGLTFEELSKQLDTENFKKFQIKQLHKWLLNGYKFSEMTDLSIAQRTLLAEKYEDVPIEILKTYTSVDGTIKFLYKLSSGELVEGVVMNYVYGNTLCISSQIGCRMGCVFCASGMNGLERNLTAAEMLGEVTQVNRFLGGSVKERKITNVVLMGSGEPLDNYDNVMKFLSLLNSEDSLNVSPRNVSLSTSGLVPKIKQLADENSQLTLTISLHNPFQEEREKIMPVAKSYDIKELVSSARYYFEKTGRRVVFEYTLIGGVNDDDRHAEELAKILKGFPSHVNCILYNEVKGKSLKTVERKSGYKFVEKLEKLGLSATLRRQMGSDIEGACGQLKRRFEAGENL